MASATRSPISSLPPQTDRVAHTRAVGQTHIISYFEGPRDTDSLHQHVVMRFNMENRPILLTKSGAHPISRQALVSWRQIEQRTDCSTESAMDR